MTEDEASAQYRHDTTELYTIDEAQGILAKRYCAALGHDFQHVVKADRSPSLVYCSRCHVTWRIAENPPPIKSPAGDPYLTRNGQEICYLRVDNEVTDE